MENKIKLLFMGLHRVAFITILMVFCNVSFAQSRLLFYKNKYKEVVYRKGDMLSFRLKGDKQKITGQIEGFEDSLIVFRYYKINPKEISHLFLDKRNKLLYFMKYKYSRLFTLAGAGYLVLDVINEGEPNIETLLISGSLITTGLITKWIIGNRIPIRSKRKLVILNI